MAKDQHVVPRSQGKWSVRTTGASKATKVFETQKEAVDFATKLAQKNRGELYIHKKDGTVRDKASYASDSRPPKK